MGKDAVVKFPALADRVKELERVVGQLAHHHNTLIRASFLRRLKFLILGK